MRAEASLVSRLLLLKPEVRELQGPAVLGYVTHQLVPCSLGKVALDFDGDLDFRSHQARQMLDNFLGDAGRVPAKAERVNLH